MYETGPDAPAIQSIDLAHEPEFDLGPLRVRPETCQVEWNGGAETLQRRVMQVLVALNRARGSVVSQEDLINLCWRGLSVTDDAIVRCIGRLRKLAAGYPEPPFAIETIPGVGYRLTSMDGGEACVGKQSARSHHTFRFGATAAAAAVAATTLVLGAIWIGHRASPEVHATSVAVRPFETLGNSGDGGSLARRIPNEIVNQLGDSQVEAALVGEEAGQHGSSTPVPGLIVTGIVRGGASITSVDVRIEDGATRGALWAMEFRRGSRDASDLPLEIAARVADEANIVSFARSAKPALTDNSSLSALLQVADMIRDPPDGGWAEMIARAQGLVARHPDFAFGHDVLAVAYAEAAQAIDVPDRIRAMRQAAVREANLTLKLDPQDAGAYVVLSDLQPTYDYRAREAILLRGLKLAKHPKEPLGGLYSAEGRLLDSVGRLRESVSLKLVAQATDEWGAPKTAQLARAYANLGNLPAARAWLAKGVQLWPNHSGIRRIRQYVAGFYENPSDGMATIDSLDAQKLDESNAIWRTYLRARAAGRGKMTAAAIDAIRAAADKGKIPREIEIMMIAGLGETKQAFDAANSAADHQELATLFLFTPITRNMRQDPAFVGLAARTGLIKYWRETGKRPDFCVDAARRSECTPQLRAELQR